MPDDYREIQEGLTGYVRAGTIIFLTLAGLFILFIIITIRRRKKLLTEKQQLQVKFQEELLRTKLEIHEQTLKNISLEIHDNIGQTLSLTKLNLATMNLENKSGAEDKLAVSHKLVSQAIHDLRSLSKSLDSDYVQSIGLVPSIKHELSMIEKSAELNTGMVISGEAFTIEPQKSLILFRMVQEMLQNILKHADASEIHVTIQYSFPLMRIEIADNGKGFDVAGNENSSTGLGIRNLHQRALLIGAKLNIRSEKGKGTRINIQLNENNLPDESAK